MPGKTALLLALTALCSTGLGLQALAADWIEDARSWTACVKKGVEIDAEGRLRLSPGEKEGFCESKVLNAGEGRSIRFAGMVSSEEPKTKALLEFRSSAEPFEANAASPEWRSLSNPQLLEPDAKPFFQSRLRLTSEKPGASPSVSELTLSTDTPESRFAKEPRPELDKLLMTMLYDTSSEKLRALYGDKSLPYDASERGMYVFRNEASRPIDAASYVYRPRVDELLLPMRYGTWIAMRIHPVATFSPLGVKPSPVVMRSKDGKEKEGALAQYRAIDFFDEAYMAEYETGVRKAVEYYRRNDPKVFAYTLMPPEFFYDTEPWPEMSYLGGFGPKAFESYKAFMKKLGLNPSSWPKASDGDICLDRDCYLWAYWRSWAGARSVSRIAKAVKESDPRALAGTMHYAGAQSLRGLEAAFVENDPLIDYYYSANMFPRVPGPDGFSGGKIFSFSRLNCLGRSRKINLAEYDIWSPYVDLQRSLSYARYARLEGATPVPILFGKYPSGNVPSDHLTKYHGMKGSPLTPESLRTLAGNIIASRSLEKGSKRAKLAVILPSFSLFCVLEKERWLQHRLQQRSLEMMESLMRTGVSFDLLTEGWASKEVLDSYKLAIVAHPAFTPQLKEALERSSADVFAIGWAGSVSAPGPKRLSLDEPKPEDFSLELESSWSRPGFKKTPTRLPGGGFIAERSAFIGFADMKHPLLAGLQGLALEYSGRGLEGAGLPLATGMEGDERLAFDENGECCFAVVKSGGKRFIRFGALLAYGDSEGRERKLLPEEEERRLFENLLDYCGIERFPELPASLRALKTESVLLLENVSDRKYVGPVPKSKNGDGAEAELENVEIPPLQSVVLPLKRKGSAPKP